MSFDRIDPKRVNPGNFQKPSQDTSNKKSTGQEDTLPNGNTAAWVSKTNELVDPQAMLDAMGKAALQSTQTSAIRNTGLVNSMVSYGDIITPELFDSFAKQAAKDTGLAEDHPIVQESLLNMVDRFFLHEFSKRGVS
jgi:hypothetical protein